MDVVEEVLGMGRPTKCDIDCALESAVDAKMWDVAERLQMEREYGPYK